MRYEDLVDFAITPEGDFELDDNGDFKLSKGIDCLVDNINFIVKTQKGDSFVVPDVGADLEELVGEPCTRKTADEGASRIIGELIQKGIVSPGEIDIVSFPVGGSIIYYVFIELADGTEQTIEYTFNLEDGGVQS